ncbi:hypothetical protein E4V01_07840 [Methylorubrum sp. Q1]|uniref:hypothetical protein n=1 Tax=Methylorubrum sp. Q1 TaxID=2562453 RepID=UPI0010764916|nr:hypothetical protein [Methylorubrum sp. Q1]TFZ59349.1 hypothetical protein E4V01_07840 [Methylorubrum sp. Q1]
MSRPAAFVADLVRWEGWSAVDVAVVGIGIDLGSIHYFFEQVGFPPGLDQYTAAPVLAPAVLILPCRRPLHPERDLDVAGEAAFDLFERCVRDQLAAGAAPAIKETIALRLADLSDAVTASFEPGEPEAPADGL